MPKRIFRTAEKEMIEDLRKKVAGEASHLEQRMIQSGHLKPREDLTQEKFMALMSNAIKKLDVNQARKEVEPFVKNPEALKVWSKEFFHEVARRLVLI